MTAEVAVFDASPLIAFHQIDALLLIKAMFSRILVPPVVAREVEPSLGTLPAWIEVSNVLVHPQLRRSLDPGEREAIALAIQSSADVVILDDLTGRTAATELGLIAVGSLGLLVRAKRLGHIDEVRPLMDKMIANGLFTSDALYRRILDITGENA